MRICSRRVLGFAQLPPDILPFDQTVTTPLHPLFERGKRVSIGDSRPWDSDDGQRLGK